MLETREQFKRRVDAITRRVESRKADVAHVRDQLNKLIESEEWDLVVHRCHELIAVCTGLRIDTNALADLDEQIE